MTFWQRSLVQPLICFSFVIFCFVFRLDVLAAIVEHVSDLSEKLCVRILAHLMLVAEDDLVSYSPYDLNNAYFVCEVSSSFVYVIGFILKHRHI